MGLWNQKVAAFLLVCFASAYRALSDVEQLTSLDQLDKHCQSIVSDFVQDAARTDSYLEDDNRLTGDHLIFFLHVPRTAGRTYNSCFLKQAFPPSKRCARSYDLLRYNISLETCRLVASHDDYSATELLPSDTAVITQLRDPVDRLLSAYEFSTEVAARGLGKKIPARFPASRKPGRTDTRNVWPWSILVPWVESRIRGKVSNISQTTEDDDDDSDKEPLDPFNNPLTIPLEEYMQHPVVDELLHDNEVLQVLGVTNYSLLSSATGVRYCYKSSEESRATLLKFAKERVANMTHVGVTDMLYESIVSLSGTLGFGMFGPAWRTASSAAVEYKGEDDDSGPNVPKEEAEKLHKELREKHKEYELLEAKLSNADLAPGTTDEAAKARRDKRLAQVEETLRHIKEEIAALSAKLGVDWRGLDVKAKAVQVKPDEDFKLRYPLWRAFRECESRTKKKQSGMREKAFKHLHTADGRMFHFRKGDRKRIDPKLIEYIRERNQGDTELHQLGQKMLRDHLQFLKTKGELEDLPALTEEPRQSKPKSIMDRDMQKTSKGHRPSKGHRLVGKRVNPKRKMGKRVLAKRLRKTRQARAAALPSDSS